ncbi:MAG: ABC transporter permease [Acidobacteriota bacterium]
MPIYDQSYRPYHGDLEPHTFRWWTIGKAGLRHYLTRRLFLIFLFIASIPAIVCGVLIWLSHQPAMQGFTPIDAGFFRNYLAWQGPFLMLVCIWPGGLLISRDLQTNAIQLYLARPLTRLDYVLGKFAILAGIGALLMPVPALLLFLMQIGLSDNLDFLGRFFWLPLSIVGYSLVVVTGAGLLSLAVSSMTRSSRYAGLLFFAIVFFSQIGALVLRLITGNHAFIVLSLPALVDQTGGIFFGGPTEYGLQFVPSILMYGALIGLAIQVLRRRVKAVEIVT